MFKILLGKLLIAVYLMLPVSASAFQVTEDNDWVYVCCPEAPRTGTSPNYFISSHYDTAKRQAKFQCTPLDGRSSCDYSGWGGSGLTTKAALVDNRVVCNYSGGFSAPNIFDYVSNNIDYLGFNTSMTPADVEKNCLYKPNVKHGMKFKKDFDLTIRKGYSSTKSDKKLSVICRTNDPTNSINVQLSMVCFAGGGGYHDGWLYLGKASYYFNDTRSMKAAFNLNNHFKFDGSTYNFEVNPELKFGSAVTRDVAFQCNSVSLNTDTNTTCEVIIQ